MRGLLFTGLQGGLRGLCGLPRILSSVLSEAPGILTGGMDDRQPWRGGGGHRNHSNRGYGNRDGKFYQGRRGGGSHGNRNYGNSDHGNRNRYYSTDNGGGYAGKADDAPHGYRGDRGGSEFRGRGRGGGGRGRGRGGPPPGLKGREIGMWYAQRSKAKEKKREEVHLDEGRERHIKTLLHRIQTRDNVPPQPLQSYRNPAHLPDVSTATTSSGANKDYFDDPDRDEMDEGEMVDMESSSWHPQADQATAKLYGLTSASGSSSSALPSFSDEKWAESFSERTAGADGGGRMMEDEEDEDEDESGVPNIPEEYSSHTETNEFVLEYMHHKRRDDVFSGSVSGTSSLERNAGLDAQYRKELANKEQNRNYIEMQKSRARLPSYKMSQEIVDAVEKNQVVVISGETGCGKTTQVAQFILDHYTKGSNGSMCKVVCTQPRRISAISVAERVAQERSDPCGGASVGYSIRLDAKLPRPQGSILFCTTGILLKYLESDPYMTKTSHVILDEIHERDLLSDILMIILKDLIKRREDLRVILMSATLNAEQFSKYFDGCPMIHIPGFTYPVEEFYLEDVIEKLRYTPPDKRPMRRMYGRKKREMQEQQEEEEWLLNEWIGTIRNKYSPATLDALREMSYDTIDTSLIAQLIDHIVRTSDDGAILVFLPGWEDIKKVNEELAKHFGSNSARLRVIPLHSMMPTVNQREVFDRPPPGVRKIVLATNIAETSITIEDVVYVIDAGKIKMTNYDTETGIATLLPEWVSRANARQRRGRAGRVQPGQCFHLFTTYQEKKLQDYQLPELLRKRLEELCLQIKLLKLGKIEPFVSKAMQTPSMQALHAAVTNLTEMNALDHNEDLTPLGYHLAKLPVDPHIGKMLLFGAMFCCLDPILTVAASLSFKDPFVVPMGKEQQADAKKRQLSQGSQSDHLMLVYAVRSWERILARGGASSAQRFCWENFMSPPTLKMIQSMKGQFSQLLYDAKFLTHSDPKDPSANVNSQNTKLVKAVLCAGLYPNVGKVRQLKAGPKVYTKKEKCDLHPKSVNSQEKNCACQWLVYHLKMKSTKVFLYDSTLVSPYPLLFFGGDIGLKKDEGVECVTVDDWIVFNATSKTANLVKDLRLELDKLLEEKITRPGPTNWDSNTKEGALMAAITDLLSKE